mgnify:CR=1 FL=1
MGKIFKNMLPYWKWILVIVAFLVMQAFCDLSLPQYTSDIIDVGIMSSGVEHISSRRNDTGRFCVSTAFYDQQGKENICRLL